MFCVFGLGQSVQKPLIGEVRQQFVEAPLVAPGSVAKASPNGRGHIAGRHHRLASR